MKKFFIAAAIRANSISSHVSIRPFIANSKEEAIGAIVIYSENQEGSNLPLQKTFAQEFTFGEVNDWSRMMQT